MLQSENDSTADVFRALSRPGPSTTLTSTISYVPPSTYRAYIHDLEEDGLPNRNPAYQPPNSVFTTKGSGETIGNFIYSFNHKLSSYTCVEVISKLASNVLNAASIVVTGSVVWIGCEFKEGIEGVSCVLVYREYGDETLVVEEYPQTSTVFPVTLTVGSGQYYTFAIFGKHGSDLEERPIIMRHVQVIRTTPTATPPPPTAVTNSGIFLAPKLLFYFHY